MDYNQDNRMIIIETPLGKDEVLLSRFSGSEGVSRLFEFELELFSQNHAIDFKKIVGKEVTVTIKIDEEKSRYFHGIVSRFSQKSGEGKSGEENTKFSFYTATMVPAFWMLTQTADSRIFQNKSIPDILKQIIKKEYGLECKFNLKASYAPKEYCVQYRETDHNFLSRLMEQEGIHYYFTQDKKKHTLIIADSSDSNDPCPNQKEVVYQVSSSALGGDDKIFQMELEQEIRVAKYTVNDYNFKVPNSDLKTEVKTQQPLGSGEREIYDYPAEYYTLDEGDRLANIRIQEEEAQVTTISGASRCRDFSSGHTFDLKAYYRKEMNDKSYLLTAVSHEASEPIDTGSGERGADYSNRFICIPLDTPFRPPRTTPKPVAEGTQPAMVVGPDGEEIYTDEFGRVKVHFIWDREGKKNEDSSCWVRVSQQWAGAGWGAMFIPHIGHEVIVDFEEGDPDRPIITGRVYNGNNKPHDVLPDEKTKSVIRSWQDNDIVFEDKDGDKFIKIKQANGNEIILHETSPNIEIFQENGNKMVMTADGPKIEVTQDCGNEILMRAGEGIQIRDEYGNEVVLDAAAGFMRLASPSHNSYMELGKSVTSYTDSNGIKVTRGNSEEEVYGNAKKLTIGHTNEKFIGTKQSYNIAATEEFFTGAKTSQMTGVELKTNISKEINKNVASRDRNANGPLKYESKSFIKMEGGNASGMMLNSGNALLKSGSSMIRIAKGGDITLSTSAKVNINGSGGVVIDGPTCTIKSKTEVMKKFESRNIKDSG
jgi:type VI secretion system secreted protein VgrG